MQRTDAAPAVHPWGVWGGTAALVLAYLALWCALGGLPFQDIPNHVSRAIVIGDLLFDGGRRFGEHFTFHWQAIPYILGDALLLPLVRALPPDVAGRAWVILEWASLPAAVAVLTHVWRVPPWTRAIALAFSLYLATDVFFMMGFANFRLAIALTLLGIAAWELALRTRAAMWWVAYFAVAVAGYLMHLSALVFLIAAVGSVSALRLLERRETLLRLLAAGLPILLLFAWHQVAHPALTDVPALQPAASRKLLRLLSPLLRYREAPEVLLAGAFVGAVGVTILAASRRGLEPLGRELAVLLAAFIGIYFVLPESQGEIWAIDNRALALAWLWAALLAAHAAPRLGWTHALAGVALAIAGANVAWLAVQLAPEDAWMRQYRALAAQVPRGAVVLPIVTQPKHGYTNPTAHAASFATIDRDAVVPYTFSGDVGMPMQYFRFRDRPRAPQQFWYQSGAGLGGDRAVLDRYPYLLVQVPADWTRIPVAGRVIRQNGAVALVETRSALADAGDVGRGRDR